MTADHVTLAAVVAGAVCFILYVITSLATLFSTGRSATADAAKVAAQHAKKSLNATTTKAAIVDIDQVTKLSDSLSKLTDSLSKASPSLVNLIGSILFFAIAALSSGALRATPADAKAAAAPPAAAPASNTASNAAPAAKP